MTQQVILNCAASLDGRIARAGGTQTLLSNLVDRYRVQALRAGCDAIVVGSGTILSDDPHLTVKPGLAARWMELTAQDPELADWTWQLREDWARVLRSPGDMEQVMTLSERLTGQRANGLGSAELEQAAQLWKLNPLRVVLDGQGRTPSKAKVVDARARTLIFTSQLGSVQLWARFNGWPNIEVVLIDKALEEEGVDLVGVHKGLESQGVEKTLVEGGSRILGSFLASGMAESLTIFHRPLVLGSAGVALADLTGMAPSGKVTLDLDTIKQLSALGPDDWEGFLVRYII